MTDPRATPYHAGPGGFLFDRNRDGHPDDLAVRLVLPPDPARLDAALWCALVELAARLGLETTGLPDRLVLSAGDSLPPDCLPLRIRPAEGSGDPTSPGAILRTAEDVRALARSGLPPVAPADAEPTASPAIADLAKLFTPFGLLRDRDGDRLADGSRLALVLPDPCPPAIGAAAIEFAARLGLESGGIDLPIAVTVGTALPTGAVVLDLTATGHAPSGGLARLRLAGGRLQLAGDSDGIAALLGFLASTWPALADASDSDAGRVLDAVRDLASATTASSDGDSGEVFALDWDEPWEVDRLRELVRDELIPVLSTVAGGPLDVLTLVSEPREIRQALEAEIAASIAAALLAARDIRVRVRSAYKAGLSWLREDVIPALHGLDGIDRVELRYAPPPAAAEHDPPRLDLPIRWLQELYPGDELLADALGLPLARVDLVERPAGDGAIYEVVALRDGSPLWRERFSPRWYQLPYVSLDPSRGSVLVSTGGIRATAGDAVVLDRDLPTDCDRFWAWYRGVVLPRVGDHVRDAAGGVPRLADQPFFATLRVDAWMSEPDESLGLREELFSSAEALHEDVYFGGLDWLAAFGASLGGDELTGPGAILPFIHIAPGQRPHARASLTARDRRASGAATPVPRVTGLSVGSKGSSALEVALDLPPGADPAAVAARLRRDPRHSPSTRADGTRLPVTIRVGETETVEIELPIPAEQLAGVVPSPAGPPEDRPLFGNDLPSLLARLGARPGVTAWQVDRSFRGRPLWAIEIAAPTPTRRWSAAKLSLRKPTLFAIGRHHANEVASTTAAFLLAERLTSDPTWQRLRNSVNVVLLPFANPDGAALHEELVAEHPTWKHHAARYNAAGLEFGPHLFDEHTPFGEARARRVLWDRWLPDVVVDNHGVPSHEWSQHFSGFGSPPRFATSSWMVQALLYGIITHVDAPAHAAFARELRRRLARALAATPELDLPNKLYGHRYDRWGTSRVPARFPADVEDGFLCYVNSAAPSPASRNFAIRFPATTTLDWVTEVPDETAHGRHLALTARAHLLANEVTLRLMAESAPPVERLAATDEPGTLTIRLHRRRPLPVPNAPRTAEAPSGAPAR